MAKTSTALRKAVLGDQSLKNVLDNSVIRIYSGTEPATADESIGSANVLAEITTTYGSGVTFEVGDDAVLRKNSNETWQGAAINTGTATFYRICKASDTNGIATTEPRIQGSVGEGYGEMVLSNASITSGSIIPLNALSIFMPASN